MQVLRWLIAGFIGLNAVSGVAVAFRAALKKRRLGGAGAVEGRRPWISPAPGLWGLWIASMAMFLASAVLLVLVEPAAGVAFGLGLVLNLAVVWKVHDAIEGQPSGAAEKLTSGLLFGLLFLAGGQFWHVRSAGPTSAPAPGMSRSAVEWRGGAAA